MPPAAFGTWTWTLDVHHSSLELMQSRYLGGVQGVADNHLQMNNEDSHSQEYRLYVLKGQIVYF
eukprot:TRINITY_DN8149_c0_g2_i1.p2 TRINITY_DN8149_c0_g2~~TRINITY_DN8149_c0_g2_i1.p2  ORF type:complete len:64 (+),score=5.15 TRINITY_DN8149_c0_g2_i1:155-346(+)